MRGLLCGLAVLVAASLPAARGEAPLGPPVSELLAREAGRAGEPAADDRILYRGTALSLDPEGRLQRRVRIVRRLWTDHSIERHGDARIPYDTTRQELTIRRCRTFMVDGTEVEAKPNAFNQVSPDRVASCPDRLGLQEMVVTHLGVERGCVIELEYDLTDRLAWRPWLEGIEEIGDTAPILRGELRIDVPGPLHARLVGEPPGPVAREGVTEWSYGPLAGIPEEGGLPRRERIAHILYSTCPDWEELGRWLGARLEEASSPDPAIQSWSEGPLASGRPPLNDEERIGRIGRMIGERTIRADDAPLLWWLPVRPAARTFETSCGNLLDRAALASAALQASALSATAYLKPAAGELVQEVPALLQFEDLWWQAGGRWLSSDGGRVAAALDPGPARELLRLGGEGVGFVPLSPRRASGALALRLEVGSEGEVRGEGSLRIGGTVCAQIGSGDLAQLLDRFAGGLLEEGTIAGFRVEALGTDTLAATFSLTGAGLGEPAGGGKRRWSFPEVPGLGDGVLPDKGLLRREIRRTSLALPYPLDELVELRLELPEGLRLLVRPPEHTGEAPGAVLVSTVEREAGAWRFRRRLSLSRTRISPEDYPAFRELLLRRLEESSNTLFFGPRGTGR